ncbi:hypothetical protein AALB51_17660, partial [Lachnospiraceae bacterium 62-26]
HVNYRELLQLTKGWGNFISDRINIWRLQLFNYSLIRNNKRIHHPEYLIAKYTISPNAKIR